MSDMPNKAQILEELDGFITAAVSTVEKLWEEARLANERTAQKEEVYREISSRASAALDYLKRAGKMAKEGFKEVVEQAEKAAAKDDDLDG